MKSESRSVALPAATTISGRSRALSLATREALWGYLFISPWIVGFLAFSAIPIGAVLYFGFTEYSVFESPRWVGLDNYREIFTDDRLFRTSLSNTAFYVLMAVPGQMIIGFVVALMLNTNVRGQAVFRTLYYLPVVVPYVVSSLLFVWILDPQVGVLKYVLESVGLPSPNWLQSTTWSKPAIALLTLWNMGNYMLIYLAGLQGIPEHLYEAAEIDGAGWWSQLRNVTIPMMTPTIFFNLIVGIINTFQVFTFAYIMTKGGPLNSTLFYVLYIYQQAFEYFQMGYASALASILFVVVLVITVVMFRLSQRWVYYEGMAPGESGGGAG